MSLHMLIISCNDDNINNNDNNTTKELLKTESTRLKISIEKGIEANTRLIYDDNDKNNIKLYWSENDKVRVYWKDNDNYYHSSIFTLKSGIGTSEGIFEGMAPESLPENTNYEILYPAEKFSESYSGQKEFYDQINLPIDNQKQTGNDNIKHLQGYNYMKCSEKSLKDLYIKQDMMTLFKFELTLPESYNTTVHGKPSNLSIVADSDIFVPICGNYDKDNKINLTLENIELETNNKLVCYIMSYPAILPIDEKMSITILTEKGAIYSAAYQNSSNREMVYSPGTYNVIQTILEPKANVSGSAIYLPSTGLLATNINLLTKALETGKEISFIGYINDTDLLAIKNYLKDKPSIEIGLDFTNTNLINIPNECFRGCNITSIIAPNVTRVGDYAFEGVNKLTIVDLPSAINIGNYAFSYNGINPLPSINIPAAKSIGNYAFKNCMNLSSINCPLVETIGKGAFYNCDGITKLNFPLLISIGEKAFYDLYRLSSIECPQLTTIGNDAFTNCTKLSSINFPSVKNIGKGAFYGCSNLCSIHLPQLTKIGENIGSDSEFTGVFQKCTKLSSVDLPLLENISSAAFSGCSSLFSVNIPKATIIENNAFCDCLNLLSIDLPSANNIAPITFHGCINLSSVNLPNATVIENMAFYECPSLSSVYLPLVTNIESFAFYECKNLLSIKLPSVTNIGGSVFYGCSNLSSIELPLVKNIGSFAFYKCSSLSSIELPLATNIGNNTFDQCSNLLYLCLPKLINLGYDVITECDNLSSIILPSVTNINTGNFKNCPKLSSLTLSSPNPISLPFLNSTNIDLTLHINKRNEVSGLYWNRHNWKSITFVDDNDNTAN